MRTRMRLTGALVVLLLASGGGGCSCSDGGVGDGGAPDAEGAGATAPAAAAAPEPLAPEALAEEDGEDPLPIENGTEEPEALAQEDSAEPGPADESAPAGTDEAADAARYPLAAVAFHFATEVRATPAAGAPAIGYLRRGARVRVAEKVGTAGCRRGWYRVEGGGYLCHGDGAIVGTDPEPWPDAPPQPRLDDPMPYDYHTVIRDDVPEYWERPTPEMERDTAAAIRRLRAPAEPPAATTPAVSPDDEPTGPIDEAGPAEAGSPASEAVDGAEARPPEPTEAPPAQPPTAPAIPARSADAGPGDGDAGPGRILPRYVRLPLARGFIVSGDTVEGRWLKSVRGRFVERTFLTKREGPSFQGVELGGEASLPMAFVVNGSSKALRPVDGPRLRFEAAGVLRRLTPLPVLGEVVREDQRYVSVGRGLLARASVLALVEPVEPPPGIGPGQKWIDISLARQTLVAYEGDRPVYATLVSSGRAADGFGTPVGTFQVRTKHVSATMDDPDGGDEAYSIEDVPWTMYFQDGYAIHAAFWHDRYGRERSHGCVNLSPYDARWIFFWSEPALPPGWHGVRATRERPGTTIVVRP